MNGDNIINTLFKSLTTEVRFINSDYYDEKLVLSDFKPFITSETREIKNGIYSQYFLEEIVDIRSHRKVGTTLGFFFDKIIEKLNKTNMSRTFKLLMSYIYTAYVPAIINGENAYIKGTLDMVTLRLHISSKIKIFVADLGNMNISFPVSNIIDIKPYIFDMKGSIGTEAIERALIATADNLNFFRKDEPKEIYFKNEKRAKHKRCGTNFIVRLSPFDRRLEREYGTIAINVFSGMMYPSTKYFGVKKFLEKKYKEIMTYNYDLVYNSTYDLCTILLNLYRNVAGIKSGEEKRSRRKRRIRDMINELFV